jgi:predicted permease
LNIAKNPLILSCAIGITLNATGIGAIPILDDMMLILGRAALPIGLLAVGAGLMFSVSLKALQYIAIGATFKLMALPIFAFAFAVLFGLSHVETGVVVLYAALPCSASAYILARQMGGDAQMMAQVITLQTIASTLTIPAMLWLLLASA